MRASTCIVRLAPTGGLLALLQHAQQLHLHRRRRVADLVEEHRAAVRLLEDALAIGDRAGERAARTWPNSSDSSSVSVSAPQLTATNGRGRCAVLVNRARDQLLAGAALAA